ncbi:MAG: WYL domain-containing protein, partial [Lachnospiraceae bacterium]|nr:WYL domain-containing protein [Lachnospiraceae bacterium]
VLHFLILDLLQDGAELTVEEITGKLLEKYEALFDIQTVRRKCNAYEKEGLLHKKKAGKTVVFSIDNSLVVWIKSNEGMLDALAFYQMAGNFGIIGNYLSEQMDYQNRPFRVKHSFCVLTLEDEILFDLLDAMNHRTDVRLEIKSSKNGALNTADCTPLQIFTSTRSGRRFLCGYAKRSKRFTCYRLDTAKTVTLLDQSEEYEELLAQLDRNRCYLWGVSFQGNARHHLDKLTMTIQALEPSEQYIVERLRREGRGGTVTRIKRNVYQYEIEVFDCNEVLPWIRTFTGRILSLECTDKSVVQRFYRDLQTMCRMYQIENNF